jgi:hypothetical protein
MILGNSEFKNIFGLTNLEVNGLSCLDPADDDQRCFGYDRNANTTFVIKLCLFIF